MQAPHDLQSSLDRFHDLSKQELYELIRTCSLRISRTGTYEISSFQTLHLVSHQNFSLLSNLCHLYSGNKNINGYVQIESVLRPYFLPKLAYCISQSDFNEKSTPFSLQLDCAKPFNDEEQNALNSIFKYIARLSVQGNHRNLLGIAAENNPVLQELIFKNAIIEPNLLLNLMKRFPKLNRIHFSGAPTISLEPTPTLDDTRAQGPWHIEMNKAAGGKTHISFEGCDLLTVLQQLEALRELNSGFIIQLRECSASTAEVAKTLPQLAGLAGGTIVRSVECARPLPLSTVIPGNSRIATPQNKWVLSRNLPEISSNLISIRADEDLTIDMLQSLSTASASSKTAKVERLRLILSGPAVARWLKLSTPNSFDSVREILICDATLSTEVIQSEQLKQRLNEWFPLVEQLEFSRIQCASLQDKQLMLAQVLSLPHLKNLKFQTISSDAELEKLATLIGSNDHLESIIISDASSVTARGLDKFAEQLRVNGSIKSIQIGDKNTSSIRDLLTKNNWRHKNPTLESVITDSLKAIIPDDTSINGCIILFYHIQYNFREIDELALYHADISVAQRLYSQLLLILDIFLLRLFKLPASEASRSRKFANQIFTYLLQLLFHYRFLLKNSAPDMAAIYSCNASTVTKTITALTLQSFSDREIIERLDKIRRDINAPECVVFASAIADASRSWQAMEYAITLITDHKHTHYAIYRNIFVQYAKLINECVTSNPAVFFQSGNDLMHAIEKHCIVLCREAMPGQPGGFFDEDARNIIFPALFRIISTASESHYPHTSLGEPIINRRPYYLPSLEVLSRCEAILQMTSPIHQNLKQHWTSTFVKVYKARLLLLIAAEYTLKAGDLLANEPLRNADRLVLPLIRSIHQANDFIQLITAIKNYLNELSFFGRTGRLAYCDEFHKTLRSLQLLDNLEERIFASPTSVRDKEINSNIAVVKSTENLPAIPAAVAKTLPAVTNEKEETSPVIPAAIEAIPESEELHRQAALLLANSKYRTSMTPAISHTVMAPPKATAKAQPKGLPEINITDEPKNNSTSLRQSTCFHDQL